MNIMRFLRVAATNAHIKVLERRIETCASALQTIALAVWGLAVLTPIFNRSISTTLLRQVGGGVLAAVLFLGAQAVLGYLPDPSASKEDKGNG